MQVRAGLINALRLEGAGVFPAHALSQGLAASPPEWGAYLDDVHVATPVYAVMNRLLLAQLCVEWAGTGCSSGRSPGE